MYREWNNLFQFLCLLQKYNYVNKFIVMIKSNYRPQVSTNLPLCLYEISVTEFSNALINISEGLCT